MKRIVLLWCLLGLLVPGMAQQALHGRVVSATDRTPLPGATVTLQHTAVGVVTDADGSFTLPAVQAGDTLLVSYIGYAPRQRVLRLPLPALLEISLAEADQGLREVVVSTGYQRIPQERATGSFAQVSAATLQEQVSTDILSRLEAVASGVSVDRSRLTPELMVRGLSTINGPAAPLIVVDNFPYEGDIGNLNPNDVESITVLKDAAAASIWGARAGNGVIVITTKKGRFNQPLTVGFNSSVSVSREPDLSYLQQMKASDFIDVEQFLFEKGYYRSQLASSGRPVLSPVVELLAAVQNGTLSAAEADARIAALRQVDVRDDFARHVYQRAVRQQHALRLSGGTEEMAWNLSAGYDRNQSPLDAGYSRATLRFNHTLRPTKSLTLTTSAAYARQESTSGKPGYGQVALGANDLFPYARLADEAGNPLPLVRDYRQAYKDTAGGGRLLDWNYYPLTDYRHTPETSALQDVLLHAGLHYTWQHGLSAEVRYQHQRQHTEGRLLQDEDSYYARNLVNRYTQLDPATGTWHYRVPPGGILDVSGSLLASHNLRGQLNFDRTWKSHSLAVIAGTELRDTRTTGQASRLYGYDEEILTFGSVDHTTPYPDFVSGRTSFIPDRRDVDEMLSRFVSQYANAAYTFREKYTLTASARRDASNLFGLHTNDLWNPLWSAGLGWDISRESFYPLGFLPFLKLRATYGFSGNTNPAMTAVTTMSYVSTSPYTQLPYARFSTYANPDLRWETVGMWNVGLDFSTKNDRLSGSLEYYRKRGRDLFGTSPVDYTAGVGSEVVRNVASMAGQGVDAVLQSLNLNGAFKWTSQLNFSYAADEVSDYFLSSRQGSRFISSNQQVSGVPGRPVYAVYSYRWAGLDPQTGNPLGYLGEESSSDYRALTGPDTQLEHLVYHGSALPTFFGGLGNTFSWKNFSLTARLSWKLGYYFRDRSIDYSALYANWRGHPDFAQRWQQPGDEQQTTVPSLIYPRDTRRDTFYAGSEVLVEKGDHVRLQYVTAAYAFDIARRQQASPHRAQVYLNLSNLGILWRANDRGIDPDYSTSPFGLPEPATAALGLKLNL